MRGRVVAADHLRQSGGGVSRARLSLRVAPPFELKLALFGHGWIDLAPHRWDEAAGRFSTVIMPVPAPVSAARVAPQPRALDVAVTVAAGSLRVAITADGSAVTVVERAAIRSALRRMLRLDHDFRPFWTRCGDDPALQWVARRGGGRLLASATLFEDLLKMLLTTNCSWAATRLMTQRLVDAIGARAASGRAAFPEAARCAAEPERFWRDVVRAGYRAGAARELARRFARGDVVDATFEDAALPTAELRRRLLALHGFGPYAAGQALRLLGRHDDLALDSWCRGRITALLGRRCPPSDRAIERRYARHGADRGLVLWLELTASWHGEGPVGAPVRDEVVAALRTAPC